jgi:hypothetical protein
MKNRIIDELLAAVQLNEQRAETADEVAKLTETARRSAERWITAHPAVCLGAAVIVGVALGWWAKRK